MNSENVDFSVVVPSYMQGAFLRHCLESVLSQKDVTFELLVFDAGSTDGSKSIIEEYRHRISYVEIEKDLGQAHAINKGMRRARGRFLCYLNSDDLLVEGALSRVCRYFENNRDVGLVYGMASYVDKEGVFIGDYRTFPWDLDSFLDECYICQPAAFWRKSVYKKIGEFDQRLNYSMDYDYWIRIALAGFSVGYLPEYLAKSRDYAETKTRSGVFSVYLENFKIQISRAGKVNPQWLAGFMNLMLIRKIKPFCYFIPKTPERRRRFGEFLSVVSVIFSRDPDVVSYKYCEKIF